MPADTLDAPHFQRLSQALDAQGMGEPTLVVDLDALERNIDVLRHLIPTGQALRLVQKSIPSLPLLRFITERLPCQRLMVFHRPWLNHYARHAPDFDLLLGKPMPVAAARAYYRDAGVAPGTGPHWLIDTPERLRQYLGLALDLKQCLSVCLEIDVGLHRGGLSSPDDLDPVLDLIRQHPQALRWWGFMGYDAHAAKAPWWSSPSRAVHQSQARYRAFIDHARMQHPDVWRDDLIFNGAGSPTVALHDATSPLNEVAVGSALLKPTDFDVPTLAAFAPALWLAVPVLKVSPRLEVPFVAPLSRWLGRHLSARAQSVYLYGGRFMAQAVWP
ncbi:MAG TPA: alanine racemase, partial [Aquabacterium sp.]|nr:alanine racemase [Aquabacterium sp.]